LTAIPTNFQAVAAGNDRNGNSCNPAVLIADEPTTALDVTVQATILELLRELRDRRQMSMMFITRLGLIAEIADSVAVMYQGKIVGSVGQILPIPASVYQRFASLSTQARPQAATSPHRFRLYEC